MRAATAPEPPGSRSRSSSGDAHSVVLPMTPRALILPTLLFVQLALAADPGRAHEYWLAPSTFRAGAGDTVSVGALAGEGFVGERKPYSPGRAVRLLVRAGRELDLKPVARGGDTTWAHFAPADRGGLLFAYESDFATITLDAATFERYLAAEGLVGPLAARRARGEAGPGRERYRRCAKSWLAGADSRRATRPLGLPCEILPLSAPGADPRLRVRVLFEGEPLVGALLNAWRQPFAADGRPLDSARRDTVGVAWRGRTDRHGEAVVPVEDAGEWLLGVVHMIPSRDPAAADWESSWASLTFARDGADTDAAPSSNPGHTGRRAE